MNSFSKIAEKICFYIFTEKNIDHKKYQSIRDVFFYMFVCCYTNKFNEIYSDDFT